MCVTFSQYCWYYCNVEYGLLCRFTHIYLFAVVETDLTYYQFYVPYIQLITNNQQFRSFIITRTTINSAATF